MIYTIPTKSALDFIMSAESRQWGLTPPMSLAHPSQEDIKQNQDLVQELKAENNYEGQAETQKRMATLKLLNNVVIEFVKEVSRRMQLHHDQIEQFGGKVFPYGSYRLGVYGPGMLGVTRQQYLKLTFRRLRY